MNWVFKDNNLSGLAIPFLILTGIILIYISLELIEHYYFRLFLFSIGLLSVATAGYAGRSRALGLRPFLKEEEWRKAKETYDPPDDKEEHS
ncbi:hypothetical protein MW7_013185 [Imbroritus primus]|uniref:Uncharacterized protein n=1 Tax=Imbroritus primus TaxID=3058603 RepID=A0ACD3SL83_9BURK|nr:hypothetical protein MW7_013185 [Burkholderiaceae bacterium PBA]